MTDVLGLGCSPRKNGNSDRMLDTFLEGARASGARVAAFYPRDLKIAACLECGGCDDTGECVIRDDMDRLYPLLIETRRIVVAAPVFFYGLPSQSKAMVDRCQALWNRVRLTPDLKRPDGNAFLLGVGATRGKNLFEGMLLTFKYFLDAIGLPIDRMGTLLYRRVENSGAIDTHPTALEEVYQAGTQFPG